MNAAVVHSFDAPPSYSTFDDPVADEEQALVTVTAVGLHQIVRALAKGTHYGSAGVLPFIPGVDGVGRLEDGTRVYFGASKSPFGTFAERCVTARQLCFPIPESLDDVTVAAMMNPGMSSWAALTHRAHFVAGESVLIQGATGAAGRLAVQIARRFGARRIIATGRNPQALEDLRTIGADAVIALDQKRDALVSAFRQEWTKGKIDIVLDYLWGSPAEALFEAITQKGLQHAASRIRFVQIGSGAGEATSLPAAALRSSGLEVMGSGFGSVSMQKLFQSLADFLREAVKQPFEVRTASAPLNEVEARWNAATELGKRLVFQPTK
jgi:NADPH:quinone reductase-like Zn-dependent oxidoreductase